MDDLRGVHSSVGGGYARSWVLLLLLLLLEVIGLLLLLVLLGLTVDVTGRNCGKTNASYIDFVFSDFDFALSLVSFALHVLALSSFIYYFFFSFCELPEPWMCARRLTA